MYFSNCAMYTERVNKIMWLVLVRAHWYFLTIFESGNLFLNRLPAWSEAEIGILCSIMNEVKYNSALVTWSSSELPNLAKKCVITEVDDEVDVFLRCQMPFDIVSPSMLDGYICVTCFAVCVVNSFSTFWHKWPCFSILIFVFLRPFFHWSTWWFCFVCHLDKQAY